MIFQAARSYFDGCLLTERFLPQTTRIMRSYEWPNIQLQSISATTLLLAFFLYHKQFVRHFGK